MKIIKLDLKKNIITLVPEDFDDVYLLSLLIRPGDKVTSWTLRQMKFEAGERKVRGERVRVMITIEAESTEIDTFRGGLKVKGRIIEAPEWLHVEGKYHSLILRPGFEVTIAKEEITQFELRRLERASKEKKRKILIVAIDYGEATIAILSSTGVHELMTIDRNIPGKSIEHSKRRKYIAKFLNEVMNTVEKIYNREKAEALVIAGPGLAKKELERMLRSHCPTMKVIVEDATSSSISGVYEVLRRGVEQKVIGYFEAIEAQKVIEEVLRRLSKGDNRVAYGLDDVKMAAKIGAIETLVVSEGLFRDPTKYAEIVELVDAIERSGGRVLIMGRDFELFQTLQSLGGIVAKLRFPIGHFFSKE